MLLVLVIDPFGNVPFFVAALKDVEQQRRRRVIIRELLIAYAVMVLFLIALRMIFPRRGLSAQEEIEGEPFIVPLAIPYVAGPSVLAVEMLLMSEDPFNWPTWLVAITAAWAVTSVVVFFGSQVAERLGPRGLIAIERLMGMILVAIAIQMFLTGADTYFGRT